MRLKPCGLTVRLCGLLAVAIGIFAGAARAQIPDPAEGLVDQIVIEGAQRIEPATIRSYLTIGPGDTFDPVELDESLKSLFATGLFADVTLRRQGNALVVTIVENPIINRIAFEGNRRIDDDVLESEVSSRPRVVYTRTRVQNDVARILEVYRRGGRFAATAEPKVIQLEQNRVDLVFEIDEGPLTTIQSISFIGNAAFSDSTLRDQIQTEESAWWQIFATSDTYDPDRLAFDRELLRRFYLSEGYADFRVISAVAELTPDREGFFVTFTVDEGERYRFGTIDIVSLLPNLDVEQLRDVATTREGDWYSSVAVEETIERLVAAIADLQYAFVEVQPLVTRDREELLINITYEIDEGPRVFVERIDIIGNVRTIDRVIRREIELVEGDAFNASRLERSEANIRNLGFFERVDVNAIPGSAPDRTVIEVEVAEQSTGELALGAGFSSVDGPLGDVTLRERNLLGRGQDLRLRATLSGRGSQLDLSFTEPYFLERDLSAGFDLFRISRDNEDESSFEERTIGFGLRAGYPLADRLRQTLRYRLESRDIRDVDDDASIFVRSQEGETISSVVGHTIRYDRLDSRIDPTDGYSLRFGNDIAGLGGDVRFLRTTAGANYFVPVFEGVVLSLSAEGGYIFGLDDDVRINDRFFVGGANLRGFQTAGIGPRDISTDDALGGNEYVVGSVELSFPIGLPEELGVKGRTFSDFGTLTGLDVSPEEEALGSSDLVDDPSLRLSVGAGLSWASPFGPLRIDFAVPLLKEDFDREENFRFSFGTRF